VVVKGGLKMDYALLLRNSEIKIIEEAFMYLSHPIPVKLPPNLEHLSDEKWKTILSLFHQLEVERMGAVLH
jgi:hypothetical protein